MAFLRPLLCLRGSCDCPGNQIWWKLCRTSTCKLKIFKLQSSLSIYKTHSMVYKTHINSKCVRANEDGWARVYLMLYIQVHCELEMLHERVKTGLWKKYMRENRAVKISTGVKTGRSNTIQNRSQLFSKNIKIHYWIQHTWKQGREKK
jgi:hypothetical protein